MQIVVNKLSLFSFFVLSISSCGMFVTHKDAVKQCYLGQIGTYKFDTRKTILGEAFSKDSIRLSGLIITFSPDSTFFTNMSAPFLDDSTGHWDAGTCGFESWGEITFKKSRHTIQFDACCTDDSSFSIIGQNRKEGEGTKYLWFNRIGN